MTMNLNPPIIGFTVREGDFFIGRFTLETAPNQFLRNLMIEAKEYGEAKDKDEDWCLVTVLADDDA